MADYVLDGKSRLEQMKSSRQESKAFGSTVLLHNAVWFTRFRWLVIAMLFVGGMAWFVAPQLLDSLGIIMEWGWPLYLAAILLFANIYYISATSRLTRTSPEKDILTNIWLQIIVDLIVLTLVVHYSGSVDTFIAFTYLFHIVLACIFFSSMESFFVVLLASSLYATCVALEISGVWPKVCVFKGHVVHMQYDARTIMVYPFSAILVWLVVWYLVSTLSKMVRDNDIELIKANELLVRADKEKTQKMLQTTHDLKAPFAGIENHIQVLRVKFWDQLSDDIRQHLAEIEIKAQTLRERIRQILLLGELRSAENKSVSFANVDLRAIIAEIVADIDSQVHERQVSVGVNVPQVSVQVDKSQLLILFSNLISNAVTYSYEGGRVEIVGHVSGDDVVVDIKDSGIGIREDALPHIFDDFYHSKEAVKFNKLSTGLGLAIVREIVEKTGSKITVRSELGKGTTFEVTMQKSNNIEIKESTDGQDNVD